MAYWHARMQNIAYRRQNSAAALVRGVPKDKKTHTHTHNGRGTFKCIDNLYGKQYNVIQLGAIKKKKKRHRCVYLTGEAQVQQQFSSSFVVGYANYETPAITLNSKTLSNSKPLWTQV